MTVKKDIAKQNTRRNPSVLEALGISLRREPSKGGVRVVAADKRVQCVNDMKASDSSSRVSSRLPLQPSLTEQDLHKAARQALFVDLDFILDQKPEFLNAPSKSNEDSFGVGGTALHYAVAGNNPSVVEYLLARGANPHHASDRGVTPLHLCCKKGVVDCAKLLIDHGACMTVKDHYNITPLCILMKEVCADPILRRNRSLIVSHYKSKNPLDQRRSLVGSSGSKILQLADKVLYRR
jgi:hypothetical protein